MNKKLIWAGVFIFGTIGSYIPALWGSDMLSGWSILGSLLGGLFGVWAGVKANNYFLD